jgi:hypothetical protein
MELIRGRLYLFNQILGHWREGDQTHDKVVHLRTSFAGTFFFPFSDPMTSTLGKSHCGSVEKACENAPSFASCTSASNYLQSEVSVDIHFCLFFLLLSLSL